MRVTRALVVVLLAVQLAALSHGQEIALTPAQIAAENGASIALVVSADDTTIGLGTGFIVANGSALVTNHHVIAGSKHLVAKLSTGEIVPLDIVIGYDIDRDLAVLNVDPPRRHAIRLGDSDSVKAGDPVVVISNPEGLERSVTNGLISGTRELEGTKFLQISAPISPGSSGGPVFNDKGEVIAVVRAFLSEGQNLNFAIPINAVKELLKRPQRILLSAVPLRRAANPGSDFSVDGAWSATFADSVGSGQMSFNLAQTGNVIAGTYTSSLGGGGMVKGRINGDTLEVELVQSVRDCPGTYRGSAKLRGGVLVGNYSGSDCQGVHADGVFSMARGAVALAPPATSQPATQPQIVQGSESELRGVRTVYVYAEDVGVRANIIKELRKSSEVTVIEDITSADVVLIFGANSFSMGSSTYVWSDGYGHVYGNTTPRYGIAGYGSAVKFSRPNIVRVLWRFQDTRTTVFERRPSTNFARSFLKVLRQYR